MEDNRIRKYPSENMASENHNDETDGLKSLSIYEKNFDGHLPLHWLQPKEFVSKELSLPSFRDLQLKTHRTLYGTTNSTIVPPRDKSPKGSVDAPIRHLVDLINSHSRFCTLSSCSGRLSLFDPNGNNQGNCEDNHEAESIGNFTEASGKGRGSWVLVSHDPVVPKELVEAMAIEEKEPTISHNTSQENGNESIKDDSDLLPWTFRFEPMLLHIAAASLEDGRRLLTIALNMGFRESGLVVTDKRVTVAIRSHSLSTVTPLFPSTNKDDESPHHSSLCVPPSYLRALVKDANERLEANWKHLDRLYRSIESTLFEIRTSPPPLVVRNHGSSCNLPALNLWNATSIGPALEHSPKGATWILGGYGCGPTDSNKLPSSKRSSDLYKIERDESDGSWGIQKTSQLSTSTTSSTTSSTTMEQIKEESAVLEFSNETGAKNQLRVRWWNQGVFPDLQGMASCQLSESLSLLWGGRKSPSKTAPADDLLVMNTSTNSCRIGTVQDVRGDLPRPRWGHQLVSLGGHRAVLLGGCNHEDGALDDIFVLHCFAQEETCDDSSAPSLGYLYWERLPIRLPSPRFHFGAALLNRDTIVMVGGLESTTELLQPFESDTQSTSSPSTVFAFKIATSPQKLSNPNTKATIVKVEAPEISFESFFGMACCTLLSKNLLLVTGGILSSDVDTLPVQQPLQAYWVSTGDFSSLRIHRIGIEYAEAPSLDFGSLVHHCCVPISENELLLLGGGAPSFAFGECYAKSHHLVIQTDKLPGATKKNKSFLPITSGKLQDQENTPNTSEDSIFGGEAKELANVLYVSPQHARKTKYSLQQKGWLEKRYRMIKVEHKHSESDKDNDTDALPERMIAIPISVNFSEAIAVFGESILGHGEEELPLSTSQYASKTKQKKR